MVFLLSLAGIQRRDLDIGAKLSLRSAGQLSCAVPDLLGTGSAQAGRGVSLPACQVYDAGELTGIVGVGPGGAARLSATSSTRSSAKRAGSSDVACRHGLMWDHTVFRVVASCRARPQVVAPSKRNCRIARRIARVPRRARGRTFARHVRGMSLSGRCVLGTSIVA